MPRKHSTDHADELQKALDRWEDIHENGCSDPFWPDGVNLNLVRNHILYHRAQLEETPTLFGFPVAYYHEVPPEVDPMYVARAEEIRTAARASLEAYRTDPNYQFILAHHGDIPPKAREKMSVSYSLNTVMGLEKAIADDSLVTMRRHERPENTLDTFERRASQMREHLQGASMMPIDESAFESPEDEDFDDEPDEEFDEMDMTM